MELQLNFEDVASAFSLDYECVFFVDVETNDYAMFDFRGRHSKLDLEDTHNFWADTAVNTEAVVYSEDKKSFAATVNRKSLLKAVQEGGAFNFKYRLVVEGEPVWFQMKAVLTHSHERQFLIIGVNNIDRYEREQIDLKDKALKSETYSQIAVALASRFDALYMVDLKTDHFVQYKSERLFSELSIAEEGENFFQMLIIDALKVVYKEDFALVTEALERETLLKELDNYGSFTLTYRLNSLNGPVYVKMVAAYTDKEHLAISVTNVDVQIRREMELKKKASKSETYSQIAIALASRFDALYMVDLNTNHFVQYKSERVFSELEIAQEGDDFFNLLIKDARKAVYKEDFALVTEALVRETLLKELDDYGAFTLTYRLNSKNGPVYVKMVAAYTDKDHLAISITNVDAQVRREQKLRAKILQNEVYGQIVMALAERYDALYMVDLETDHFAQYKAERMYSELNVAAEGEDFFNQLQKDALQVVYAEDLPLVQAAFVRDVLLKELDDNGLFSLTYRLNSPTGPLYVNLVAVYSGEKHIVISVTNVDTQVRREQKIREEAAIAYQRARRDDLTGIKNKNAYGEFESKLNEQIESGEIEEFAIAICDVNGLKTVNDTQGHKAGDDYIRSASKLVCDTFKHSPVFRVGGDEFVVILKGSDFESREDLEKKFEDIVKHNAEEKKVVVACGISVFDKAHDKNVSAVFERADALMYKNKMSLKGGRDEILNMIIRTIGARTTI